MAEQELQILTNGEYKNINLKTRVDKKTGQVQQGLTVGNHIIVEKGDFTDALEIPKGTYNLYRFSGIYKGEEVAWFGTRQDEADEWAECGGVGDKVKITLVQVPYKFKGKEDTRLGLSFELVA